MKQRSHRHPARPSVLAEFLTANQTMDAGKRNARISTGINKDEHFTVHYNNVLLHQILRFSRMLAVEEEEGSASSCSFKQQ